MYKLFFLIVYLSFIFVEGNRYCTGSDSECCCYCITKGVKILCQMRGQNEGFFRGAYPRPHCLKDCPGLLDCEGSREGGFVC